MDCDTIAFEAAGSCPHCGMVLVQQTEAEHAQTIKNSNMTIAFYLQNGVEVLDFAGPMEVFSYAGFKVFTVSKTKAPIVSQGILTVTPDYSIEDAPAANILAFFGGNSGAAANDAEVINWVKAQQPDYYFSVCTGAFVLGQAGILDQQTATTFHRSIPNLRELLPQTTVRSDVRYVDNGRIITTAGISAGIDGALHLVARLKGAAQAREIAWNMEYDKYQEGEGLIINPQDNPYLSAAEKQKLQKMLPDYVGTYAFRDGGQTKIHINPRDGWLYAEVETVSYPLHFQDEDHFRDLSGRHIQFIRDTNGKINGYRIEGEADFYERL